MRLVRWIIDKLFGPPAWWRDAEDEIRKLRAELRARNDRFGNGGVGI